MLHHRILSVERTTAKRTSHTESSYKHIANTTNNTEMECRTFNRQCYQNIKQFMENKKGHQESGTTSSGAAKAVFSKATLINNWYEDRVPPPPPPPQVQLVTEQMDKYRRPCRTYYPDRKELMRQFFDGQGSGKELMMDHHGDAYYNNFVTTYDLAYNHLTKGLCGPFPRRYYKGTGEFEPSVDMCRLYGNITEFGLKKDLEEEKRIFNTQPPPPPVSETKDNFRSFDLAEVKKANQHSFKILKSNEESQPPEDN